MNIELLENTFAALEPQADKLVERFYEELFSQHPAVKPLFKDTDPETQPKKLLTSLKLVVSSLREPEKLEKALHQMGKKHQQYGALEAHYPAVAETLLGVMEELAGELWTDEVEESWSQALNFVASTMLEAYEETEEKPMATTRKSKTSNNQDNVEITRLRSAVTGSTTPMMMVDRDLVITYANPATIDLLTGAADELRSVYPGFDVDKIIGTCIDDFHKKPEHQRKLLSDPNNLPYQTDIQVGNLTFALNVTAQMDAEGNYIGNTLEWNEVTEARKKENEVAALQSAVTGSTTPMMMVDRDLVITYANPATIDLLTGATDELRSVYPGFDVDKIVGTCIDDFHKKPAHQRQLLSDPNNLPYQTDIQVGNLTFALNVTAQMDVEGNYIGNTLEWNEVTEARKKENEVAALQSAVTGSTTPMMMVDRDLVITYANPATIDLLTGAADELRTVFPGFDVDKLIGTCIDDFHKKPEHQRKLLSDPKNLPYQTDIQVGNLTFALNVTAQMDVEGNYIGNTLEWNEVTEERQKEIEVVRLQSAVDGAQANLMLCDEDLNITYANPAVVKMLEAREDDLIALFPSFSTKNLIGTNIDQFHKHKAHQRGLLANVDQLPFSSEIKVAHLEFGLNATAITDADGNYMGNMVEWRDITDQKVAEREIQALIGSANAGELDARIPDTDRYEGFIRAVADGINSLMNTIVTPVRETSAAIHALSEGDLTRTVDGEFNGEFGQMTNSVNDSISNLRNMVGDIREAATNLQTSASEISQGNLDLSNRTEQQASSLEETASSMEEITGTVRQTADNARQANQLSVSSQELAEKGSEVVGSAVSAMSEINDSSRKIADIIGVIDEIAFQTNLLALNAAVEAARAGEQGRGFAVVASEVRNLAQRSAGAAKEIKSLINDSVQKVEEGSRLVDESGEMLGEITDSAKKVSDIIAEIAAASQEQSTGIEQVNKAVTQMDQGTQQNAALVEEAAAASESMDEQSRNLTEQMKFFNTGNNQAAAPQERRATEERPWTAESAAPAAPAVAVKPKVAAASTSMDSDEWDEF